MDTDGRYHDGVEHHALAVWSVHAADLALQVEGLIEHFAESPTTQIMVRDRELMRMRPGIFLPGHHGLCMPDRAVAIGCALGDHVHRHHVIAGTSAAWVLLGGHLPLPLELLTTTRPRVIAGVAMRQAPLQSSAVESIGGAPVTVPVRTAVDMLRYAPPEQAMALVEALIESGHCDARAVIEEIRALDVRPYARRARGLWSQVVSGRRARAAA